MYIDQVGVKGKSQTETMSSLVFPSYIFAQVFDAEKAEADHKRTIS